MRRSRYQFRDNTTRARIAEVALGLCAVVQLVDLGYYGFLWVNLGDEDLGDFEPFEQALGFAHLGGLLFCAIAFLFWIRRAYENAAAAGMRLRHSLGYSVGGWFIPFANLWIPPQVVGDAYRHALGTKGAGIVALWWTAYLVSGLVDNISNGLMGSARTFDAVATALMVGMGGSVLSITAGVCALWIVHKTTANARVVDPGIADVFGDAAVKR